jgi:multicomponent Na+:H+ antiporter subunit G
MEVLDLVRQGIGGLFVIVGLLFVLGGTLGLLRFPDFYTRLHAVGVSDAVGGVLLLIGLAVLSNNGALAVRVLLLAGLIIALAPTLAQLAANAAHAAGLAPLAGRYTAPRPGVRKGDTP